MFVDIELTNLTFDTMPAISCPLPDCPYTTDDVEVAVAAVLLTIHATHHTSHQPVTSAKVEKVKRPTLSSAGSSKDWAYFESGWMYYCDEVLHKDLTRNNGGFLASKTEAEALAEIKSSAVRVENCMVA